MCHLYMAIWIQNEAGMVCWHQKFMFTLHKEELSPRKLHFQAILTCRRCQDQFSPREWTWKSGCPFWARSFKKLECTFHALWLNAEESETCRISESQERNGLYPWINHMEENWLLTRNNLSWTATVSKRTFSVLLQ